jgi:geranylgeranyl pyrophosphate synthase
MSLEQMKQRLLSMPEVAAWPQMVAIIGRARHEEYRSLWDYPLIASRAVGGTNEQALAGSAAILCSLASVHLVDDMLDEEPGGDYRTLGAGNTANLALAFQAAGHRALDESGCDGETRAALQAHFARMALATASGQNLDGEGARSEDDYWRIVEAKTPPLFGSAFYLGARLAGAAETLAAALDRLGGLVGLFIQVSDDLVDAMKTPAGGDWARPFNNLAILFAMTAEHGEREDLVRLAAAAGDDPAALDEAQRILLRSGALSYCALKLIELQRQARDLLARLPLADPAPIERLLETQIAPLNRLFQSVGVETPAMLLPG